MTVTHILYGMERYDLKAGIAKRIKTERIKIYGTQEALAERIGKRQSVISRWESGDQMPNYEHMVLLAGAFQITVADLAGMPYVTPPMPDERAASAERRRHAATRRVKAAS